MKYLILILLLTGCGSAPTDSGSAAVTPQPTATVAVVHSYVYSIAGNGVSYAADLYWDMSTPQQSDSLVGLHTIVAGPDTYPIGGFNTYAQITNHGGGTLTVTLFRDGVSVQVKTIPALTAATMSQDL